MSSEDITEDIMNLAKRLIMKNLPEIVQNRGMKLDAKVLESITTSYIEAIKAESSTVMRILKEKGIDPAVLSSSVSTFSTAVVEQAKNEGRTEVKPGDATLAYLELGKKGWWPVQCH